MRWATIFGIGSVSLGAGAGVGAILTGVCIATGAIVASPWIAIGLGIGAAVLLPAGGLTLRYRDEGAPPLSDQQRREAAARIDHIERQTDEQQRRLDGSREPQQQARRNTRQARGAVRPGHHQPQYHALDSLRRETKYTPGLMAGSRRPSVDSHDPENLFGGGRGDDSDNSLGLAGRG